MHVGSRFIDIWVKILPKPSNIEQIKYFQDEFRNTYQFDLQQYINLYERAIDHDKTCLNNVGQQILLTQKSWIAELKEKIDVENIRYTDSSIYFCLQTVQKIL